MGDQLDSALAELETAGVSDDAEIIGGGVFGVIDESNWQICEQSPAAGDPVTDAPSLTVDRSCDQAADLATTETEADSDDAVSGQEPEEEATEEATTADEPAPTPEPEVLTVENNQDLARLMAEGDAVAAGFAEEYAGMTIAFDGSFDVIANHDDYDTRWDFSITYGDYSETTMTGPHFVFEDVNRSDLHLEGPNVPDGISVGDQFHFVADVVEYDADHFLFYLDPVSTTAR